MRLMRIKITDESSQTAGFITWQRLAIELFPKGELKPGEHVTHFEISEHGINYFVSVVSLPGDEEK
jgi:hypothetical protein